MPLEIHVHHHIHIEHELDALGRIERAITTLGAAMSQQFDALKAEVERSTTVQTSVQALVQGLAAQIEQMKDDPVALQDLADKLRASDDATAAAVAANTPAEPTT